MKSDTESQTAVMVCMARAIAHGRSTVAGFSDPTAASLLPAEARARLERFRAGKPKNAREGLLRAFTEARAKMMAVRTVAVDQAVRSAGSAQVVILGAGLDGRAWRMPELRDVIVFEVDHPDSQRRKRERAAALQPSAREVRFVEVDFEKDRLDDALATAGQDPSRPTTWIWEGVAMYLEMRDIEAALTVIERRSAPGSRLVVVYNAPSFMAHIVGLLLRRVGEPFRTSLSADQMRALIARHRFRVGADDSIPELAGRLAPGIVHDLRFMKHARVAVADRSDG